MIDFEKINKKTARKLYNEGKTIYIIPCKVYPDMKNYWIKPFDITYTEKMKNDDIEYPSISFNAKFDTRINNYEFYNCNYETGYHAAFYIGKISQ